MPRRHRKECSSDSDRTSSRKKHSSAKISMGFRFDVSMTTSDDRRFSLAPPPKPLPPLPNTHHRSKKNDRSYHVVDKLEPPPPLPPSIFGPNGSLLRRHSRQHKYHNRLVDSHNFVAPSTALVRFPPHKIGSVTSTIAPYAQFPYKSSNQSLWTNPYAAGYIPNTTTKKSHKNVPKHRKRLKKTKRKGTKRRDRSCSTCSSVISYSSTSSSSRSSSRSSSQHSSQSTTTSQSDRTIHKRSRRSKRSSSKQVKRRRKSKKLKHKHRRLRNKSLDSTSVNDTCHSSSDQSSKHIEINTESFEDTHHTDQSSKSDDDEELKLLAEKKRILLEKLAQLDEDNIPVAEVGEINSNE